ncbi:MAG: hypothetical protein FGM38_03620 [Solirubrobacterales bacterium]|nr:hypothetical protein [Solirubrobacterales bacterium]
MGSITNGQLCRLRAPASGRESLAFVEGDTVYRDEQTGEELDPVAVLLPLAPTASRLPRAPLNLRICRRCRQLTARDLAECQFCGLVS